MQPIFESSTQKPCKSLQDFRVPRLYLILCLLRRISMALRRSNATVFDGDGSSWELVSNASSSTSESTSSDGSSGSAVPGPPADGAAAASGVSPGGAGSVLAAASAADRRRRAQLRFKWATRLRNPGYPMNQVEKPKRCVQFQRDWEQSRLEYYLMFRPQEGMDVGNVASAACRKYAALAALMHKKGWKVKKPAKCQVPEMMHLVDPPSWLRVERQLPEDNDMMPFVNAEEPGAEDQL